MRSIAQEHNLNISNLNYNTGLLAFFMVFNRRKELKKTQEGLYYIPDFWIDDATTLLYDPKIGEIIPAIKNNVPSKKEGGRILFAAVGNKVPDLVDFDPNGYTTAWGNILYGINDKGVYGNSYKSDGVGNSSTTYKTDPNYQDFSTKGREYATSVENQQYYKDFTNVLLDEAKKYIANPSSFTKDNNVFLKWAFLADANLPEGSLSTFFDKNGQLRKSWTYTTKDNYGNSRGTISNVLEYITKLRTDGQLGPRHSDLMREGIRFYRKDSEGNKHWVDPEVAKSDKYIVSETGTPVIEGNINWTDYEITDKNTGAESTKSTSIQTENGSKINPNEEINKPSWYETNDKQTAQTMSAYTVAANRLANSLRTNNRIARIVQNAYKPVLENTYELYSPITGAFSERQFYNKQAADLRRQAATPYTSDPSQNLARKFEANVQAQKQETQGMLADNSEVRRTIQEALKRQEDNLARRTTVANNNKKSIINTNLQKAMLEASRLNKNYQSIDNFWSGIESDIKGNLNYNKQLNREIEKSIRENAIAIQNKQQEQKITNYYENKIKDRYQQYYKELREWRAENGQDNLTYIDEPFYKNYQQDSRKLNEEYYDALYGLRQYQNNHLKTKYSLPLSSLTSNSPYYQSSNWWGILQRKKGGKLSPTTQYLLNKVMK